MEDISEVSVVECKDSRFVQPFRVKYKQDGVQKFWDCTKIHDSVAILIYNKSKDAMVFVRQFRPAVYMAKHRELWQDSPIFSTHLKHDSVTDGKSPTSKSPAHKADYGPGSMGFTYELCAGIIDKPYSLEQIAKEEVLEETGYDVPIGNIEKISCYYSSIGHAGSLQTLFYCEVTEAMHVSQGGGNVKERESIQVLHVPTIQALALMTDESVAKPTSLCFAMLWFDHNKRKK